jgi:hypothetical protein
MISHLFVALWPPKHSDWKVGQEVLAGIANSRLFTDTEDTNRTIASVLSLQRALNDASNRLRSGSAIAEHIRALLDFFATVQ